MTDTQILRGRDYINGRDYLVTIWPNGSMEIAHRDEGRSGWSIPIPVELVPAEAAS